MSIIGLFDFMKKNLALISNSKKTKVKNAPTGSINERTPLIIPRELPIKKPTKKIITRNEYLRHGLAAQFANLSIIFEDDLYKNVFCILRDIRKKTKKLCLTMNIFSKD